jgi:ferrous iron transport protein B
MTFPGLDANQIRFYEEQRNDIKDSFLSLPEVRGYIEDQQDLLVLEGYLASSEPKLKNNTGISGVYEDRQNKILSIAQDVFRMKDLADKGSNAYAPFQEAASAYMGYRNEIALVKSAEKHTALMKTIAGRIGKGLEVFTGLIGFDYRVNISLLGGFAAKEVIISTLGTAYSLDEVEEEESGSLSQRLKNDPEWNPLMAFTLILFVMLYVPCLPTIVCIKRESSWKWAAFSIVLNLIMAYIVALVVYRGGYLLGIGV